LKSAADRDRSQGQADSVVRLTAAQTKWASQVAFQSWQQLKFHESFRHQCGRSAIMQNGEHKKTRLVHRSFKKVAVQFKDGIALWRNVTKAFRSISIPSISKQRFKKYTASMAKLICTMVSGGAKDSKFPDSGSKAGQ
jgi:hypothetical protein